MTQSFANSTRTIDKVRDSALVTSSGFGFQDRRRNWRGIFALGFLFVSALAGYGFVFVLIDKWYKGGTLGIF